MRGVTIWRKLLGVEQVQVLDVTLHEEGGVPVMVISVRPTKGARGRCGQCGRRCPGYDQGGGIRRWRALDHGSTMVFVQAPAPRVTRRQHWVVVAAVPWGRPGARAARAFEDQCAWLAARTAKTVVGELMRPGPGWTVRRLMSSRFRWSRTTRCTVTSRTWNAPSSVFTRRGDCQLHREAGRWQGRVSAPFNRSNTDIGRVNRLLGSHQHVTTSPACSVGPNQTVTRSRSAPAGWSHIKPSPRGQIRLSGPA